MWDMGIIVVRIVVKVKERKVKVKGLEEVIGK